MGRLSGTSLTPVRDYIVTFHTQIFDAKPEVKNLVVADGAAVVEADFVGRHVREFAGSRRLGPC